jgi:hypothetical protein
MDELETLARARRSVEDALKLLGGPPRKKQTTLDTVLSLTLIVPALWLQVAVMQYGWYYFVHLALGAPLISNWQMLGLIMMTAAVKAGMARDSDAKGRTALENVVHGICLFLVFWGVMALIVWMGGL